MKRIRITFDQGQGRGHPLLLLDEFTVLGKLDFVGRAMAFLRGFGARVYLSIQLVSQLYEIYGRHQSITATCPVQVAFTPADVETAELLSKMTGQMAVVVTKRTLAGNLVAVTPSGRRCRNRTSRGLCSPRTREQASDQKAQLPFPAR